MIQEKILKEAAKEIKEIEGISPINIQDIQNGETIAISEEIQSVFKENNFLINGKTKKGSRIPA